MMEIRNLTGFYGNTGGIGSGNAKLRPDDARPDKARPANVQGESSGIPAPPEETRATEKAAKGEAILKKYLMLPQEIRENISLAFYEEIDRFVNNFVSSLYKREYGKTPEVSRIKWNEGLSYDKKLKRIKVAVAAAITEKIEKGITLGVTSARFFRDLFSKYEGSAKRHIGNYFVEQVAIYCLEGANKENNIPRIISKMLKAAQDNALPVLQSYAHIRDSRQIERPEWGKPERNAKTYVPAEEKLRLEKIAAYKKRYPELSSAYNKLIKSYEEIGNLLTFDLYVEANKVIESALNEMVRWRRGVLTKEAVMDAVKLHARVLNDKNAAFLEKLFSLRIKNPNGETVGIEEELFRLYNVLRSGIPVTWPQKILDAVLVNAHDDKAAWEELREKSNEIFARQKPAAKPTKTPEQMDQERAKLDEEIKEAKKARKQIRKKVKTIKQAEKLAAEADKKAEKARENLNKAQSEVNRIKEKAVCAKQDLWAELEQVKNEERQAREAYDEAAANETKAKESARDMAQEQALAEREFNEAAAAVEKAVKADTAAALREAEATYRSGVPEEDKKAAKQAREETANIRAQAETARTSAWAKLNILKEELEKANTLAGEAAIRSSAAKVNAKNKTQALARAQKNADEVVKQIDAQAKADETAALQMVDKRKTELEAARAEAARAKETVESVKQEAKAEEEKIKLETEKREAEKAKEAKKQQSVKKRKGRGGVRRASAPKAETKPPKKEQAIKKTAPEPEQPKKTRKPRRVKKKESSKAEEFKELTQGKQAEQKTVKRGRRKTAAAAPGTKGEISEKIYPEGTKIDKIMKDVPPRAKKATIEILKTGKIRLRIRF